MRKMNKVWAFLAARHQKPWAFLAGEYLYMADFPSISAGLRARGVVPIKDIYKKIKKENECGCWQLGCEPDARAGHYAFASPTVSFRLRAG